MVSISVEPPTQVQRGTVLYPPLVVSCQNSQYVFFQIVLLDSQGQVVEQGILQGTPSASPQLLHTTAQSSRGPKDYAVFPNLAIGTTGIYTLRVDAYEMDYQTMDAVYAASMETREIRVRSSEVSAGRPSSSEVRLLDRLARAGFRMS
ncbi:hypothetical protein F5Y09DRAFT_314288 [Xylaria sp. FL1042]|nr:hypothetical protein F5Y09DRAFT_314288 [Xylaria sp. FL1042]